MQAFYSVYEKNNAMCFYTAVLLSEIYDLIEYAAGRRTIIIIPQNKGKRGERAAASFKVYKKFFSE